MKHFKKYGKFVFFYLIFALVSYLLTTTVIDRLPAVVRDSTVTFAIFLIFNFILIPVSATKEVLLSTNKYSPRMLTITTFVSILIIFIASTLLTNNTPFLPYTLNSINKNELVDRVDLVEIKANTESFESTFHKSLKNLIKGEVPQDIYCTPNIYDLNPKKLDLYFPSRKLNEFVSEIIHKDPSFYNIFICNTDSLYFSISADRVPSSTTDQTGATSSINFLDLKTGEYSDKTIKVDSLCQNEVLLVGNNLFTKCTKSTYDTGRIVDETTLYQINTKNLTVKKLFICKKSLMGKETCLDQNQNKYYEKISTMQ